ncbi:MAG: tetratricopeptide repeat protein [Chloroflexota bacterium]
MRLPLSTQHSALGTFFLLLCTSLVACNLAEQPPQQPNIIIVTATAIPATAGPTQPPTDTPTPTLPPTPTVLPEVALQTADSNLLNGYYEKAVDAYKSIVNGVVPDNIDASGWFGLGRAALREGLFTDSVDALTKFITQYAQDARVAQAYFLRGDAYSGLSKWAEALADFQQYQTLRPGLIDSYVDERIGDAQLALGRADNALASYANAAGAGRSLVPLLALREKVAQVDLQDGQLAPALAQYNAILAVAKNAPYRAEIEYAAAKAVLDSGDTENGLARMQNVLDDYPNQPEAYHAMQALIAGDQDIDDLVRGKVSFDYGDYEGAIDAFNTYTTQYFDMPADMQLLLGQAYREIGNSAAAITAFQTLIQQYPTDALFGQALLEQARTKFLAKDIDGAIQAYIKIADNYAYLPEAAEALWRAGYLYGTNDNPTQSRAMFERLADKYPDTDQAKSGLFLAASAAYNLNDPTGAEQLYAKLAVTTTGEDQAAAYLWVGKLATKRNDPQTANDAYQLAEKAAPDSYFSARAQDILRNRDSFARPLNLQFKFDDTAQLADAEKWLRDKFAVTQEGALWPLSSTLQADARLIRGNELWAVGSYAEAEVEFSDVITANKNDALASYQLAIFLRGLGAYQPSIIAASNIITLAGVGTLDAPAYVARMRYPAYYQAAVLDSAQQNNLDPLLLFSLIRHESLFDPNATGGAGEKGLTQIIPVTAEYIAQKLQWPNYQPSDLFRPYVAIEFGAYFLSEQVGQFDNNVQAALAGYNAGPSRAAQWLDLSGGDPDQFMTAITIDSTRNYVQSIYGFYNIYRALYGAAN